MLRKLLSIAVVFTMAVSSAFVCRPMTAAAESAGTNDAPVRAIYLFKNVMESNTEAIKTNGFNTVLIFRVGVLSNGDLVYSSNADSAETVTVPVCSNGVYIGGSAIADKIKSLKAPPTTIDRVEVSMVTDGQTYESIRDLIAANGTGPETVLYKNFQALKEAWNVDAINDDDEQTYHLTSTVSFAKMLGDMGYEFTICPYTRRTQFWVPLVNQLRAEAPGLVDRCYLMCYDGGRRNDPGQWQNDLGMKVVALLWVTNDYKPSEGRTPEQMLERFATWHAQYSLAGGGYWNEYDIERMHSSYADYVNALNTVFVIPPELTLNINDNDVLPAGTRIVFHGTDLCNGGQADVKAVLHKGSDALEVASGYVPESGVYQLKVTAEDVMGNTTEKNVNFVIYDPDAGFVTGGGWINSPAGAYAPNGKLQGKASFELSVKYNNGHAAPTGEIKFEFKPGNLLFRSDHHEWLVLDGAKAQVKGTGTVNGRGEFGFLLTALDGKMNNAKKNDRIRMKIWDTVSGEVLYDNQAGAADYADLTGESTLLGGGSIVIHLR